MKLRKKETRSERNKNKKMRKTTKIFKSQFRKSKSPLKANEVAKGGAKFLIFAYILRLTSTTFYAYKGFTLPMF